MQRNKIRVTTTDLYWQPSPTRYNQHHRKQRFQTHGSRAACGLRAFLYKGKSYFLFSM